MKAQLNPKVKPDEKTRGKVNRKFAYLLAWVSFLSAVGLSIFNALKDHKVPERDEYI